ncbi:hypothetical protein PHMEG_0005982 [Phytophthora megakarya]|uniref:Uncharacterized protein n=1 Tax=Phytophthora megakarya TaxID=4795 RepID=A0A225WRR2_9STRA|nr:hypothetical protein PHMEG_0005982 [Phytophthora megakarya]
MERWSFLKPWWTALIDQIVYEDLREWGFDSRDLQVFVPVLDRERDREDIHLPYNSEKDFFAHFHKIREGLLLLATVAHVDAIAWRFLLSEYCKVDFGKPGEMKFEEKVLPQFVLVMDLAPKSGEEGEFDSDLVQFCGDYPHEHPSAEFQSALKKIESLDDRLDPDKQREDVIVPVQVNLTRSALPNVKPIKALVDTQKGAQVIRKMWKRYLEKNEVAKGSLRPMFHLEPIVANLVEDSVSMEFAETIETLVHDNVWFSRVILLTINDLGDEELWNRVFSRLMSSLFDTTRRNPELSTTSVYRSDFELPSRLLQLGEVNLSCFWNGISQFESICSALVLNQTTQTFQLKFYQDMVQNEITSKQIWKWLAYALFSKRARVYSALESLKIRLFASGLLIIANAEAFAAVATSECPEEELFDWPRGSIKVGEAGLKSGTLIRWRFEDNYLVHTFDSKVPFVLTYSDDGMSEWVEVLVPGYGKCEVQRTNILETTIPRSTNSGVTSLQLSFNRTCSLSGLPRFMEVVGPSLKHLALGETELEANTGLFLDSCPNLETMYLRSHCFEARLNFRSYTKFHQTLPDFSHNLNDPIPALKDLCDGTNPLTKYLCRLRVSLSDIFIRHGRFVVEKCMEELLTMLKVNQSVEYFDIIVHPDFHEEMDKFLLYDRQPIFKTLELLSMDSKIAFLSVVTQKIPAEKSKKMKSQGCNLVNEHVVRKIFAFAATPVVRRVYIRKWNGDEDDDLPI